nr:Ger(x)C family spore germination protein [Thermoactinomyces sp. CICC 10521]
MPSCVARKGKCRVKYLLRAKGFIVLLSLFLLTGCWDSIEIEKRAVIVSLAIDKGKKGYEVTAQVPSPGQIVGGGGGGGGKGGPGAVQSFTAEGETLRDALSELQSKVNNPIFLGHLQTLLLSKDVAKEGISRHLDALRRSPEIRRHMWPIVIDGKAKEAMKTQVGLEPIPTDYLRDQIDTGVKIGKLPTIELGQVMIELSNPQKRNPLINMFKAQKEQFDWEGMAVFRGDRMVGVLDERLLTPIMHIRRQRSGADLSVPCGKAEGTFFFHPENARRKVTVKNGKVDIQVKIEGEINEKTCPIQITEKSTYQQLSQLVAREYEKIAKKLVERSQKEFRVDVMGIGNYVHAFYPKFYEKMQWRSRYANIPIQIHYKVTLRRIGLESS